MMQPGDELPLLRTVQVSSPVPRVIPGVVPGTGDKGQGRRTAPDRVAHGPKPTPCLTASGRLQSGSPVHSRNHQSPARGRPVPVDRLPRLPRADLCGPLIPGPRPGERAVSDRFGKGCCLPCPPDPDSAGAGVSFMQSLTAYPAVSSGAPCEARGVSGKRGPSREVRLRLSVIRPVGQGAPFARAVAIGHPFGGLKFRWAPRRPAAGVPRTTLAQVRSRFGCICLRGHFAGQSHFRTGRATWRGSCHSRSFCPRHCH